MNKSESKYYNTALLMNQALVELLNKKDYEFITIKEICQKAGVNRSTFYLHYDNIDDLLTETIENTNKKFQSYFASFDHNFTKKINENEKKNLFLITPEYLLPYLNYIKDNKVVYQVSAKHPVIMQSVKKYNLLQENILYPILKRFEIPEKQRKYFTAYYIHGIFAIVSQWLKDGCQDEVDMILSTIIACVGNYKNEYEAKTQS